MGKPSEADMISDTPGVAQALWLHTKKAELNITTHKYKA
jgi:hypothetical protein